MILKSSALNTFLLAYLIGEGMRRSDKEW